MCPRRRSPCDVLAVGDAMNALTTAHYGADVSGVSDRKRVEPPAPGLPFDLLSESILRDL